MANERNIAICSIKRATNGVHDYIKMMKVGEETTLEEVSAYVLDKYGADDLKTKYRERAMVDTRYIISTPMYNLFNFGTLSRDNDVYTKLEDPKTKGAVGGQPEYVVDYGMARLLYGETVSDRVPKHPDEHTKPRNFTHACREILRSMEIGAEFTAADLAKVTAEMFGVAGMKAYEAVLMRLASQLTAALKLTGDLGFVRKLEDGRRVVYRLLRHPEHTRRGNMCYQGYWWTYKGKRIVFDNKQEKAQTPKSKEVGEVKEDAKEEKAMAEVKPREARNGEVAIDVDPLDSFSTTMSRARATILSQIKQLNEKDAELKTIGEQLKKTQEDLLECQRSCQAKAEKIEELRARLGIRTGRLPGQERFNANQESLDFAIKEADERDAKANEGISSF